jgi:hypothetical protein
VRGLMTERFKDWRLAFNIDGPAKIAARRSWQDREHDAFSR